MKKVTKFMISMIMILSMVLTFVQTVSADAPPAPYFNGFETDISGWDAFGGSFNPVRVASGTNGITSASGGWHAEAVYPNVPATNWGGYSSVFPSGDYSTLLDIYLDVNGGFVNDTRFDFTSAINKPDGLHRRDFAFNGGFYDDATGPGAGFNRFVFSASNNTGRANSYPKNPGRDPIAITQSGWYTFKHTFYDNGSGVLAVDLSILDSSNTVIKTWTLSDATDVIGLTIGGNRYGWFATNEFAFLAFDNTERTGVEPNQPPVADANGPYLVAVDQSVLLDGSGSSDPDGDPLTETWMVTGDPLGTITGSTFEAGTVPGITQVTLTVNDGNGGTATDTAMVVVYDPDGGFVTGGGWILSPEEAMPPTLTNVTISGVSGDTSVDPDAAYASYYLRYVGSSTLAGFDPDHNYQWASPSIFTPSPEDGPLTLSGTIDVGNQTVGQVAMIGLLDRDDLAAGNTSFQRGAYIYIYRSSETSWRIGVTDGNSGGEIVQAFVTIADTDLPSDGVINIEFTLDGTADGSTCATGPYTAPAGCMTLQITGGSINATLTDSYGDIVGNNSASPEFANGAVPGWDDYLGSNVGYTLTMPSMLSGSPEGKATFGFVSKYKKGADVPTGNTEFQFQAGDLNFHSTSYDWLVVTGSDYAKFKGTGTINGEGEYKFMLWAGDDEPDTFRIKIWYENGGTEVVVYDNGMDQAIGGGSIVVHKK
jgi:hypothetical protein